MKRKQATLLTLVGVSALGLLAMVVGTHGRQLIPSFAEPTNYSRFLGPTEFEEDCVFENYAFGGKNDSKKFKCELRDGEHKKDGKYMEGAILYGDCDHQSVGANLSEPFVLDNSAQGGANNADFHIFFSAQGITYANFYFDIELDEAIETDLTFLYGIKYTNLCSSGLYSVLDEEADYSRVTSGAGPIFYNAEGGSTTGKITAGSTTRTNVSYSITRTSTDPANAVAFQVNPWGVPAGRKLTITLKSVTINYTC